MTDVLNIPSSLAVVLRSFETVPEDKKSEGELLDWLVHGDDYFSMKQFWISWIACDPPAMLDSIEVERHWKSRVKSI